MSSFKEAREMLLLSHDMKVISDEELLLLLEENKSRNPEFSYGLYNRFDLDDIPEPECKAEMPFNKNDIPALAEALDLPETFTCSQRSVADTLEGLCLLLRRTAYPCRFSDLIPRFGRPIPELSMITNCVIDYIYNNHGHRVTQWNHQILRPPLLQQYADAIYFQDAPLDNCFGFVDGTVRPISRPVELQEVVYNGHKRVHAIKFQSVTTPSGLIANLFGPVEGRAHDAGMLGNSHLLDDLVAHAYSPTGQVMCLYGDPAYPLRAHLQAPFRPGALRRLTPAMELYNKRMSKVRTSVEWIFGDIVNSFKFLDYKKNLKIGLSTIGKMYVVCAIIRNALTCMYGNLTSTFFDLDPPTVYDYFS